jgi:hypothetical protein
MIFLVYCFGVESVMSEEKDESNNILGGKLELCCSEPVTGFYRDGFCHTGPQDLGSHVVCAEMTEDFLEYTKSQGNDLSTPNPAFSFPGLKPGDRWCLCAARWKQAYEAGKAPKIIAESTHEKALQIVPEELLLKMAIKN